MMSFGAIAAAVAAKAFDGGNVAFIAGLGPALIIIIGIVAVNPLNLYGMFMSTTTTITSMRALRVNPRLRLAFITSAAVVASAIALAGQRSFLPDFENFILFLAYFMVPWTAINLVDFYFVRRERYDIAAIFDPRGRYRGTDFRTLAAYLTGIGVEIPFMSTSFYTGPAVALLGGADISWIVGLAVAADLYYVLHRSVAGGPAGEDEPVRAGVAA
jgi:NCS1 family nucleobase:cation symporter-1